MTWLILRKELLANLLSLRFALGLALSAAMMGIAGYVLLEDYAARHQTYLAAVQEHQEALQQAKVYSTIAVTVDIPPSPLSIFSRGASDLPTAIRVSPYVIPSLSGEGGGGSGIYLGGNSNRPYNPLLRVFSTIDLVFVVSTILSLFALLLVFDSFSGEREQGTLPLLMTCPVGRLELLAGKFLGALVTVAVPLALGFLEVLLLWSFSPDIEVGAAVVGNLGVLFFLSLAFLAAFLGLGLLVSLCVRDSSTGLMYLLLAWVLIAVVIPEGGGALAQYLRPQESRRRIVEDAARVRKEFYDAYLAIPYEQKGSHRYMNSDDLSGQSLLSTTEEEVRNLVEYNKKVYPLKFRFAETSYRVVEQYEIALRQWGRLRDSMVSPSLCHLYQCLAQALAGTDFQTYDLLLGQMRQYRQQLVGFLQPRVGTPEWITRVLEYPDLLVTVENEARWNRLAEQEGSNALEKKVFNWDRISPLDLRPMPKPHLEYPDLASRLQQVWPQGALLAGIAVLLLALTAWRVRHYPVF
jgi:ABC-type transport system involved in multi-copper enzyme maturation permease subunit